MIKDVTGYILYKEKKVIGWAFWHYIKNMPACFDPENDKILIEEHLRNQYGDSYNHHFVNNISVKKFVKIDKTNFMNKVKEKVK